MMYHKLSILLMIAVCYGCKTSETEKYQSNRNNIIHVKNKIKKINTGEVLISRVSSPYIIEDYLFIRDNRSMDKLIFIFDKKDFNFITSIVPKGKGPGEIANMIFLASDDVHRKFYVTDAGKQRIFSYDLDSVLTNPAYIPETKMEAHTHQMPIEYTYISDSLCIGVVATPTGNAGYDVEVAKWNIITGEFNPLYQHSDIKRKRVTVAASAEHGIYAECYENHDLMTICSLDGKLKYNVYGNKWNSKMTNQFLYYDDVAFCKDRIIATHAGGIDRIVETQSGARASVATQFLVFDIDGNYLKTLETGYDIITFCYDKDNSRLVLHLDDEMQFAYLDLDGLI